MARPRRQRLHMVRPENLARLLVVGGVVSGVPLEALHHAALHLGVVHPLGLLRLPPTAAGRAVTRDESTRLLTFLRSSGLEMAMLRDCRLRNGLGARRHAARTASGSFGSTSSGSGSGGGPSIIRSLIVLLGVLPGVLPGVRGSADPLRARPGVLGALPS
eukprot:CAMPEP_0182874642 /NCGR_PEP_ID=MMETSP0034_2-20130328/13073_1 /TAXON_ID=156128 /ORGANISM="Nephroselmis pyriformis, Strain CCMP717" /LENGTH=159 /DNA_ID=CAMNT_0025007363 /DNA_START=45 /DNA_END=521 /DNA_ORIENTATION=+